MNFNLLGILSSFTMQPGINQIDFNCLADSRDYNLLLIAAEQGHAEIVKTLLQLGMITDLLHIDAQTLAWEKRRHDVLLELLKANLAYPKSFDIKKCSAELKEFFKSSNKLHNAIKTNNVDDIQAILDLKLDLKYYYNSSNDSALKTAIIAESPEIYDILLEHKIRFAPHEDAEELYQGLEYEMKRTLREIHNKYTQVSDEKHLNILFANSFVCHDDENAQKNVEHIQRAFWTLNANVFIRIILMIVAASKKFKIIFDFNRDSVSAVDPTVESNTQGLFYLSGRIYIGAKQLLDKSTEHEAFGVIAHELCHFAMDVVYGNEAKPYTANDNQTIQEFEEISEKCRENSGKEKIVDLVYDCYPPEMYHAELIVRVVHMLAFYFNQPEKLLELREYFGGLFNFYENKVVPEMKAALPIIEKKVELEIKKKDKKISKLRFLLFISIGLGIVVALLTGFYFYKPNYKFSELSEKNQGKVQNAVVIYKNITVKFNELFPGNFDIFEHLTSDHILLLLGNKALNFNDPKFRYLEEQIDLKWENLTGNLRENFLDLNLNYQSEIVVLKDLYDLYPAVFNNLTSQQIINVLSGNKFKIGKEFMSEIKFYVERKFIPEYAKLIVFEYTYGHENVDNSETRAEHVQNRTKDKSFQEFYTEFLKKDFNEISQIFDTVKQNSYFKAFYPETNHEDFHFMHKTSTEIIEQIKKEKILILSSEAGVGKTATFEQLTMKIKKKFPTRWVSYIDLPNYTKSHKSTGTAENLLKDILGLNSEKNNFEVKIFEESFKSGNLVLIWNAFDKISQTFNNYILNVIKSIHETSSNIQFVCTRPLYSERLRKAFKVWTWQLVPFDKEKKQEFLREFFKSENVSSEKIQKYIEKGEKIIEKLNYDDQSLYNFETRLMLLLIPEIHESDNLFESANIFGISEAFLEKKIEIWLEKGKNTFSIAMKLLFSGSLKTILQKFALLNEFNLFSSRTLSLKMRKLQIMQKEIPEDIPIEEISRMGILFINGKNNFQFSHKTLSEFFVAQYFIENIFNIKGSVDIDEAELRLELFFHLTHQYGYVQQIITDFMTSYLQLRPHVHKKFNPTISKLLRTKFKNFFIRMLDTNYPKVFEFLFEFFKPDHDLLVDLLHVHEPETFYTALYNPNNFALLTSPEEIKSLAQNCLTDAELQKFVTGKNKKGKILFGIHFYTLLNVQKFNYVYNTEIKALRGTSFWDFFSKINVNLTVDERKELFVAALSPKIYLLYKNMFSTADFSEYKVLWVHFENILTQNEMQDALGDVLLLYFETYPKDKAGHEKFLNLLLEKAEKFLSNSQIFEMFLTKNILHEAHFDPKGFKILWNFLSNHTNVEERRKILLQDDLDDKNFYFYISSNEVKKSYSIYKYRYFYYDFTPFKIIHRALTVPSGYTFDYITEIYQKHFSKSEIQEIVLSSNDFLYYVIGTANEDSFEEFASFLEDIFDGNEKKFKEFLERKIVPANMSVFEFVEEFRVIPYAKENWFNNLEALFVLIK